MKTYKIIDKLSFIEDLSDPEEAGLTEDEQNDMIKELKKDLKNNMEYLIKSYKNHINNANMIKREKKELNRKQRIEKNKSKRLKKYIDMICKEANIEKESFGSFKINHRTYNKTFIRELDNFDIENLPEEMTRKSLQTKTTIEKLLEDGKIQEKDGELYKEGDKLNLGIEKKDTKTLIIK